LLGRISRRRAQRLSTRLRRFRIGEAIKQAISTLYAHTPEFRQALDSTLSRLNGQVGQPSSFDALDELLNQQTYRLAHWRVAAEEINYRRFFDVNDLIALRMEDETVFTASHQLLLVLLGRGLVSGLRIDHPDGLRDPLQHLWRLQRACFVATNLQRLRTGTNSRPDGSQRDLARELEARFDAERRRSPDSPPPPPAWVVVEKILSEGETLPASWPVHGTTGYDFLNDVQGLFVNRANRGALDRVWLRFVGQRLDYADLANSGKKTAMLISFPGEVNRLGQRLKHIAAGNRHSRDLTLNSLVFALREFIAALPVYRTYIDPTSGAMTESDRHFVRQATDEAIRRNRRTDPSLFEFVYRTVTLEGVQPGTDDMAERLEFISRLQQTSGPVCAKGVEDTAFYTYNRLCALNEVGGAPQRFGLSVREFHARAAERQRVWPHSLLATSTHDSKRSEDVRARLVALSEMPRQWSAAARRWSKLNSHARQRVDGAQAPSRNDEYLLYQTLVGTWRAGDAADLEYAERISAYMLKAARESKVQTSWITPNAGYEGALAAFIAAILEADASTFVKDLGQFCESVAYIGMFNSLSQVVLKMVSPGVPDLYQGNELWDFSLVDPDNRRPVDFELRQRLLADLVSGCEADGCAGPSLSAELLEHALDGRIKLFATHRCLAARAAWRQVMQARDARYLPLQASGSRRSQVCAFARVRGGSGIIALVPVLIGGLLGSRLEPPLGEALWRDTTVAVRGLSRPRYRDWFTGETVEAQGSGARRWLRVADVLS
ncbi:MAG: malto-oligosyltrehalose synthase, partial [Chloroflexota bacterium]